MKVIGVHLRITRRIECTLQTDLCLPPQTGSACTACGTPS